MLKPPEGPHQHFQAKWDIHLWPAMKPHIFFFGGGSLFQYVELVACIIILMLSSGRRLTHTRSVALFEGNSQEEINSLSDCDLEMFGCSYRWYPKLLMVFNSIPGGGNSNIFWNFHPDPWGNDRI